MKIRKLLTLVALGAPILALAKPADPRPFVYTNPDGSTIEVRQCGDEYFAFLTDAANTMILEQDARGFVKQAVRNGRYLTTSSEDIITFAGGQQAYDSRVKAPAIARMASLDSQGRTMYPSTGSDVHSLVVLIQFDDRKFMDDDPVAEFNDMLNKKNYDRYGAVGSVRDYFEASSNGQFTPIFDIAPVVTLSAPEGYDKATDYYCKYVIGTDMYGNQTHTNPNARYMFVDACRQLEDQGFDFSKYDYDENGIIDTIYFFYAGYGAADSGYGLSTVGAPDECVNTVWPHQTDLRALKVTLSGLSLGPIACSNEVKGPYKSDPAKRTMDGIGTFCHEYSHVLGLPDLYCTTYGDAATPGDWSLMCSGSYNADSTTPPLYSAYEQWVCRWLDYDMVEEGKEYDIPALTSPERKAYRLNVKHDYGEAKNEYYVFESRANSGWDAPLADHGMLVWHIAYNATIWSTNTVNNTTGKERVLPIASAAGSNYFAFPGRYEINYISQDKFQVYDIITGSAFNPFVTGITHDAETGVSHFQYNMQEAPDVVVEFEEDKCNYRPNTDSFCLQWTYIPGDDITYEVNIWRNTTSGASYIANVQNRRTRYPYIQVNGAGTLNMKRELHATVKAFVNGVPSKNLSKEFVFTPNQLAEGEAKPDLSSVETLETEDTTIVSGPGFILAPQGAEVYNMQGARCTNTDNLASGLYIVRHAGRSVKVMVK